MRIRATRLSFVLFTLLLGISLCALNACQQTQGSSSAEEEMVRDSNAIVEIRREFGLPVDSFHVVRATIERNQFLANILSPYGINAQKIATIARKSKAVFDIRDLQAGAPYAIFCTKDSTQSARYFVYQPNPIDYVVYDLRDSIRIYKAQLPVTVHQRTSTGKISSSLFEALAEAKASTELAIKLANIYAWDIDFYAIQKGDWFKVIYEEKYVNDQPVGLGRIQSAVFSHEGDKFYAFYYNNDSTDTEGYYDEQAKSLRKAFLKAPLKFYHITSHYTRRRFHPVQHRWKAHLGTDYAAPTGTPIMATAAGTVIASTYSRFNGNYVKIRHNSVYTTQYLHMSKRAVRNGAHVQQGQIIGYVGSTGLATGPHVCYRFWKNGRQVNPLNQHFPAAEPIDSADLPLFNQLVHAQKDALDAVSIDSLHNVSPNPPV